MSLLSVAACSRAALGPGPAANADASAWPDVPAAHVDVTIALDAVTPTGDGPGDCLTGLVTTMELASTPRADTNLELLALKLSPGRVVANQATYDRVVRDVGAIRAQRPDLATISYFPAYDGKTVDLTVDLDTAERMKSGIYASWNCLNTRLGAVMPFEYTRIGNADNEFVFVGVKGIYAIDLVGPEYGRSQASRTPTMTTSVATARRSA